MHSIIIFILMASSSYAIRKTM